MEGIARESSRLSSRSNTSKPERTSGRPSILSKAYNTVSYRGSRVGTRLNKVTSPHDDDGAEKENKALKSFSGVFDVPDSESRIVPPAKLTVEQEAKYATMLDYFQQQKEYPTNLQPEGTKQAPLSDWEKLRLLSHESLLRYLRATRWDVNAAKKRLTETIAWRREFGVDDLDADEMAKEAKSGKETVLGYDKRSRPLHYMHPHRNDTKETPRQMQFAVWILERCIDLMPPGTEQLALLINFDGKSRNPTSIANAKLMLYILQNHYVERLGIALCINVPWVFKMFWNAIQPFIDPVTKSKCKFDEAIKDEVPVSQLSSEFGGDLDATYNHDLYWPDLVKLSAERRKEMLRRFKEDCNSEVGASEWVIRGGDDKTSPFSQAKLKDATAAAAPSEKTSTSKSSDLGPSSDPLGGEKAREGAVAVSDRRRGEAKTPAYEEPPTPMEKFKTPTEVLNANPLERSFSTASSAGGAQAGVAAATTLPATEEAPAEREAHEEKATEEASSGPQKRQSGGGWHHFEEEMTKGFKDINQKLHGSIAHALHRDGGSRKSGETATSSREEQPQEGAQLQQASLPSATEAVALTGTAGVTAAAGAIGAATFASQPGESSSHNTINVFFFAAAKEAAGAGREEIELPQTPFALSMLAAHLVQTISQGTKGDSKALESIMQKSRWSVNEDMIDDDLLHTTSVNAGDDVAIIPPVSGG